MVQERRERQMVKERGKLSASQLTQFSIGTKLIAVLV
jgi:hypothetical protein